MKIAIVTGASTGMGRDFAEVLDSQKLDEIWAVARTEKDLISLADSLKTKVKIFPLDLSKMENLDIIEKELVETKPEVCWLVNVAGFGKFDCFENISTDVCLNMINLNICAMVKLTNICVPFMPQGSRIVDFSSVAGFQPVPYANIYSATKAFVLSYSRALNFELKHKKISVTCVCPYWTKTQFFDRAVNQENKVVKKYVVMYDPKKVVKKAFKNAIKRKPLSIYGFVSNAQVFLTKIFSANFVQKVWLKMQKINPKTK